MEQVLAVIAIGIALFVLGAIFGAGLYHMANGVARKIAAEVSKLLSEAKEYALAAEAKVKAAL